MSGNAQVLLGQVQAWNAAHPNQRLDPAATLAVASREGLSGAIGDGGHAFGDFQLNNAGGVITGKFAGMSPAQIEAWANTPQGINFALSGLARVAANQTGQQAVNSIVSRYERPANIPGEIAGATAALGSYGSLASLPVAKSVASTPFVPKAVGTVSAAPPATPTGGLDASTQALLETLLASHPANQTPVAPPTVTPLAQAPASAPTLAAPTPAFAAPAALTFQSLAAPPVFK